MGNIDFAKLITAAASSSLGILSLAILAISLIALKFFSKSGDTVKFGVFSAMFLAVIGLGGSIFWQKPTPSPIPAPAPTPTPAVENTDRDFPQDISGAWRDEDGFTYVFKIVGTTVSYEQLKDGIHAGSGKGTIDGQNLQYTYVDDRTHDTGACTGLLSNDGTKIDGSCGNNSGRWGFKVTR